jgi:HrpA-like RNA helicase
MYNNLPAAHIDVKNELKHLLDNHQLLLISGEAGCGKTTQIPKIVLEHLGKKVVCTQPRIIPTHEIAKRVAEEMNVELGTTVGYRYRHNNMISDSTVLTYLTDGTLLKEAYIDPHFNSYGAIIIDEAHERSVIIDILLLFCKEALKVNTSLRVIIMSATINLEVFREYFKDSNLVEYHISGRLFEVERIYRKPGKNLKECLIKTINSLSTTGDILIFMTTKKEIDRYVKEFSQIYTDYKVYALYSGLPRHTVSIVTEPDTETRKIIFSTNVGETSLTIKGIKFVIDPGFVFTAFFCPKLGGQIMKKMKISQSSSIQRTGRAGRVEHGIGILLYTEKSYDNMLKYDIPHIEKNDITSELLSLFFLLKQTSKVREFLNKLIIVPASITLDYSLNLLKKYKAIVDKPTYNGITKYGFKIAKMSIHPTQAYCIYEAKKKNCGNEMIMLLSLLDANTSLEDFIIRDPIDKDVKLPSIFKKHQDTTSDHITLLKIFNEFLETDHEVVWCKDNGISYSKFITATYTREQLAYQINCTLQPIHITKRRKQHIINILAEGYYNNIAKELIRVYDNKPVKNGITMVDDVEDEIVFTNICAFEKKRVISIISKLI